MRTSRSGFRTLLLLSWYPWPWCLFDNKASAASMSRDSFNRNIRGRSVHEMSEEGGERVRYNRKKNDELAETENPTDPPTSPSSSWTQLSTLAPSDSTQSPTDPPTTSPTELTSAQLSFGSAEVPLLPFSILIHGSLSMDDEYRIRYELQEYLLDSFREELVELMFESIDLKMIQMVESYIPPVEAEEGDNQSNKKNLNRHRSLRYIRRLDGHHPRRHLQSASSVSTVSTLIEYKASASILYVYGEKDDTIDNKLQALQERQIEALEDNEHLQDYFLVLFQSENELDEDVDNHSDHSALEDDSHNTRSPVVLMAVQVANRPSKPLNSTATWEIIESMLDSSNNAVVALDASSDTKHESTTNVNDERGRQPRPSSDISYPTINNSNERKYSWKVNLGIGCIFMILVSLVGIILVRRKKSRQSDKKSDQFSKRKISPSGKIVNRVNHEIRDVDSDEGQEAVAQEQNEEMDKNMSYFDDIINSNEINAGSGKPINPIVTQDDIDRNPLEIPVNGGKGWDSQNTSEKRSSKKSSFIFLIGNSLKKRAKREEKDHRQHQSNDAELDSDGARMNLYNAGASDDDSIMGYSLTSQNRAHGGKEERQDDRNSFEDLDSISNTSSQSNSCNPVAAGIHKTLERDERSNDPPQYTPKAGSREKYNWKDHQDRSRALFEEEITNDEQGESLVSPDTFETQHTQKGSTRKDESIKGLPATLSVFKTDEMIANDSNYFGKDEIMGDAHSGPSEEFRRACVTIPLRETESKSENYQCDYDVSDAPSDERKNDVSVHLSSLYHYNGQTRQTDTIRNSKLLDNDPAVLSYLLENTRSGGK